MPEEDVYYLSGDEILDIRRNIKPREGNRSIKGSKSMEHLPSKP